MRNESQCLLVIPHYQDTERLQPFLEDLLRTLDGSFSILVSDDGSGDEHFSRLRKLLDVKRTQTSAAANGAPEILEPITTPENRGKGAAVYAGWSTAGDKFALLAFVDSDGAVSAPELMRARDYFGAHLDAIDLLAGSRIKMLGRKVIRHLPRHLCGRVFATMVHLFTGLDVYDSQCGLKLMKRAVFEDIRPRSQCHGFAFDVEMLLLARKSGHRMEEFPVDWRDVSGSKVSLLRHSLPMLLEIIETSRRVNGAGD